MNDGKFQEKKNHAKEKEKNINTKTEHNIIFLSCLFCLFSKIRLLLLDECFDILFRHRIRRIFAESAAKMNAISIPTTLRHFHRIHGSHSVSTEKYNLFLPWCSNDINGIAFVIKFLR